MFFFFNDTATTEIYTLSLHDALPICTSVPGVATGLAWTPTGGDILFIEATRVPGRGNLDRKSTRLNSSHSQISYAVFCLKKKKRLSKSKHRSRYAIGTNTSRQPRPCT